MSNAAIHAPEAPTGRLGPTGEHLSAQSSRASLAPTLLDETRLLGDELEAIRPAVLKLARRVTRDEDASFDVVQRAFLKVLIHASQFEGRAAFRTWVWQIARNEAIQWCRERTRVARQIEALSRQPARALAASPVSPLDAIERRRTIERLRSAIASLAPKDRWILEHTLVATDSPISKLCAHTGVGTRTLRTRLHRARQRLRRTLEADL